MIDSRLVAKGAELQVEERRRPEAALQALGDVDTIVAAVERLLAGEAATPGALPNAFEMAVLDFVESYPPVLPDEVWQAIARALPRRIFAESPSRSALFDARDRLLNAPFWVGEVFLDTAVALLRSMSDETRKSWLDLASRQPLVPAEYGGCPRTDDDANGSNDPFEVWDGEGNASILFMARDDIQHAFRRLDFSAWFRAVDAWPEAPLVFAALFCADVKQDRARLFELLASAASTFAASGEPTGRVAAIVLANDVVEHAEALSVATRMKFYPAEGEGRTEITRLRDEELPAFFDEAWSILLMREDGISIAAALHHRLTPSSPPSSTAEGIDVKTIGRSRLVAALREIKSEPKRFRELASTREKLNTDRRVPRHFKVLTAFFCALELSDDLAPMDDEIYGWLSALLLAETSAAWRHDEIRLQVIERSANLLAKRRDAAVKLGTLYTALERGRRASEFGVGYEEQDADFGSYCAVLLMARVAAIFFESDREDEAARLASDAFDAARRLYLASSKATAATFRKADVVRYAAVVRALIDPSTLASSFEFLLPDPVHAAEFAVDVLRVRDEDAINTSLEELCGGLRGLLERVTVWSTTIQAPKARGAAEALAKAMACRGAVDGR